MIAIWAKPAPSSVSRMRPTRPSIMSDGATMSAPAAACDSAARASASTVASLTISSPSTMPQWPCEVYSQRHTSVTTSRPGTSFFSARAADWTGPSGSAAPDPAASFDAGSPKSSTPGMPSAFAADASVTISSTDNWKTPGIDPTSRRWPLPGTTNSG